MRFGFATNDPSLFIAFVVVVVVLGLIFAVIHAASSQGSEKFQMADYDKSIEKIIERARLQAVDAALRYKIDSVEISKIIAEQYNSEIQDLLLSNFDDSPERTNLYITTINLLETQINVAAQEAIALRAHQPAI